MATVYLYGGAPQDNLAALWAALNQNIPVSHVTGDYCTVQTLVEDSNDTNLVIAVGNPAGNNLYYCCSPCYYTNGPTNNGLPDNEFEHAAGPTAYDSFLLANALAYYAIHGSLPYTLPSQTDLATDGASCPSAIAAFSCP